MILPVEFGFRLIYVACMCVIVCCCTRQISGPCQAKGYLSRCSKQKKRAERLANAELSIFFGAAARRKGPKYISGGRWIRKNYQKLTFLGLVFRAS